MVPYRDMIIAVRDKMQPLISQGKSVQEVMAANITAPYATNLAGATKVSTDRFITEMYEELKGGK
jgi:hypothetical protein